MLNQTELERSTSISTWAHGGGRILSDQTAIRAPQLDHFEDLAVFPSAARLKSELPTIEDGDPVPGMATMIRAKDGGSLRKFRGGLAHENGWAVSWKAKRQLHWEGETALNFIVAATVDPSVAHIGTESVAFEVPIEGGPVRYTIDVELVDPQGRITLVELKRSERDLRDPDLRLKLAYVREICRRAGMRFVVVFKSDIFNSITHRRNAHLFASRGFVHVRKEHQARLRDLRSAAGRATTYGALAEALEPGHPVVGRGVAQAMLVRGMIRMDLTRRLEEDSLVTIV